MSLIGQAHTVPGQVILWGVQDLCETVFRTNNMNGPKGQLLRTLDVNNHPSAHGSHGIPGELSGIGDRSMKMTSVGPILWNSPYNVQPF